MPMVVGVGVCVVSVYSGIAMLVGALFGACFGGHLIYLYLRRKFWGSRFSNILD